MKKNRLTLLNILSNILLQAINVAYGFIVPKIILCYFGSNVNGLICSITQFLSYITIVEGGITGVVMASLYKPLVVKDNEKISSILKTSNNFYKKIGIIYIFYSMILAFLYPLIFNYNFSYKYIFTLVIILSINMLIQYMYSLTFRNLLNADKKCYIVSFTQSIILVLTMILGYISIIIYPSIHIFKLITGLLFILQPIIYKKFINENYKFSKDVIEDKKLLSERWNGFAINVAAFIHNSTDIVILTIFTNLATVSIYSVYATVTNGLKAIVSAISNAIVPTLGQAYASEDNTLINEKMDIYEFIIFNIVFLFFTVAGLLITPFILIYTSNITDANYNQFIFGILIVVSEGLYLLKFPHLNLSYSANKFKELTKPAYIEAILNIAVSLMLVKKLNLVGVAIGTICGMTYRLIYQVYYSTKLIKNRKQKIFYFKLIIYSLATIFGLFISNLLIPISKITIISWVLHAIIYMIIFGTIYLLIDCVFFKKELLYIKKYLIRR